MSDLIAVTGNLTSSPLRHAVSGGVTMVTFGLASTERRFDNGTWTDVHTNFYSVSVFRKLAEHAYASLEKGQRVILSGKLKVRSWEANGKSGTSVETSQDVVDLVKMGNIDAIQAVRQAGRDIGEVLTACVSLMNPSVIAIGGSMAQAGEHLIAGVREIVYARSMPLATGHLSIVQSTAGASAAVLGASMLAIHHALSPENIDAMAG